MLSQRNCKFLRKSLTILEFYKYGSTVHFCSDSNLDSTKFYNSTEGNSKIENESKDPVVQKYQNLFVKSPVNSEGVTDKVYLTNFGSIRFDSDNIPFICENVPNENLVKSGDDTHDDKSNYFDEIYFGESINDQSLNIPQDNTNASECLFNSHESNEDLNFVDSQFFQKADGVEENTQESLKNDSKVDFRSEGLNHIDQQYIYNAEVLNQTPIIEMEREYSFEDSIINLDAPTGHHDSENISGGSYSTNQSTIGSCKSSTPTNSETLMILEEKLASLSKLMPARQKKIAKIENKVISKEEIEVPNSKISSMDIGGVETPKTAFDFVIKKRSEEQSFNETKSTDGLGRFKKIVGFVPNFKDALKYDITKILYHSVIYDKNEIVAINKPYGISMHAGGRTKNSIYSFTDLLPDLAERMHVPVLHPVHRLDMNTTGVLLLAKSSNMADYLKKLFKQRLVQKSYLAITKTIPNPLSGIIDIPIGEGHVDNYRRMVLFPDVDGLRARNIESKRAVTKYKVLSHNVNASLVELNPATGIKHQLRVHLGLGLSCPILGDHKYSHFKKMAPQRLPGDILNKLALKQSKVRDLPMFLHSWRIELPAYLRHPLRLNSAGNAIEDPQSVNDRNIKIRAVVPKYFKLTLKYLSLSKRQNFTQDMKIGLIMDRREDWE